MGPYVQSDRQKQGIYMEYAKVLLDKGEAYYCFCGQERLNSLKRTVNGEEIMTYDKHCLNLTKEEVEAKLKGRYAALSSARIIQAREKLRSMMRFTVTFQ